MNVGWGVSGAVAGAEPTDAEHWLMNNRDRTGSSLSRPVVFHHPVFTTLSSGGDAYRRCAVALKLCSTGVTSAASGKKSTTQIDARSRCMRW